MNSGTLQGIATLLTMIAFLGICVWAYSGKRKAQFNEAANLPFADEGPFADDDQTNHLTPSAAPIVSAQSKNPVAVERQKQ